MSETITWTAADLDEFDTLTNMASSPSQMARIEGRLKLREFVDKHGKPKCDAMFAEIERRSRGVTAPYEGEGNV